MTIDGRSLMACTMLRWGFLLLLGVLAGSLIATSTVHAREFPGIPTIECSGVVSGAIDGVDAADGESGEAPAEKAPPLQHATCHAPATSLPALQTSAPIFVAPARDRLMRAVAEAHLGLIHRDIRPPIA